MIIIALLTITTVGLTTYFIIKKPVRKESLGDVQLNDTLPEDVNEPQEVVNEPQEVVNAATLV